MHWLYLFGAIIFEVMGTLSIKQTTLTNSYYWGTAVAVFYIKYIGIVFLLYLSYKFFLCVKSVQKLLKWSMYITRCEIVLEIPDQVGKDIGKSHYKSLY